MVTGNYCDDGFFAFSNQFVVYFYRRKDRIDIGVFRVGKGKAVCSFQAFLSSDNRAFDLCLPADIIVSINTQNKCPAFCHWYIKITLNLLNYYLR